MDHKELKKAAAKAAKEAKAAETAHAADAALLFAEIGRLEGEAQKLRAKHSLVQLAKEDAELRARAARTIDRLADSDLLDVVLGKRAPTNEEKRDLVKRKLAQVNRGWSGPNWYWCDDIRRSIITLYRSLTGEGQP